MKRLGIVGFVVLLVYASCAGPVIVSVTGELAKGEGVLDASPSREAIIDNAGTDMCIAYDYAQEGCDGATAFVNCMKKAFVDCQPGKGSYVLYTLEGRPIFYELSIQGRDSNGNCIVLEKVDNRKDTHASAPGVTTRKCEKLASRVRPLNGCEVLELRECM